MEKEPVMLPDEEVEWEWIEKVVPDAAEEFVRALGKHDTDWFVQWADGSEESDDGEDDAIQAAWDKFRTEFHDTTGLDINTSCSWDNEYDQEPRCEYVVEGAWTLSGAGKKIFRLLEEDDDSEES